MPPNDLPALLGGAAVCPHGQPPWPLPDPAVAEAVARACADGSWGRYHGGHAERLEAALCAYHGVPHVLLCGSGTYAVELGLRALKVGPGDEVLLAGYDYPGNFLTIHALGAHPVLVDLDPDNWNLALDRLDAAIGPRTRAVLASHLHGGLVPMRELMAFAAARHLAVLEDAAQAPGAIVQGRRGGTWGDVGTLSFGGSKLLTAGRGGALLTPHAAVAQRARAYQLRGNLVCPLSELQAAALLPQLDRLDAHNEQRRAAVRLLAERLAELPGVRPFVNRLDESAPTFYKVGFQYDAEAFGLPRARLAAALRAEGVALDESFAAAHVGRSPRRYRAGGTLTETERAHRGCVVLHHPVLLAEPAAIEEVAAAWHKVHKHRRELTTENTEDTERREEKRE